MHVYSSVTEFSIACHYAVFVPSSDFEWSRCSHQVCDRQAARSSIACLFLVVSRPVFHDAIPRFGLASRFLMWCEREAAMGHDLLFPVLELIQGAGFCTAMDNLGNSVRLEGNGWTLKDKHAQSSDASINLST